MHTERKHKQQDGKNVRQAGTAGTFSKDTGAGQGRDGDAVRHSGRQVCLPADGGEPARSTVRAVPVRGGAAKAAADARTVAWQVLETLEKGMSAQEALDTALRATLLEGADKALCTELVYGCLRMEIRIAVVLERVLPQPEKLPRACWLALALAAYAMLFLQKIPHYAIVNWAVNAVQARWGQGLARVVNGALRSLGRIAEEAGSLPFYTVPALAGGKKAAARAARATLARWYSMPQWIVDIWCSAYGEAAARSLLERSFQRPWACLRVNARHAAMPVLRDAVAAWAREHDEQCVAVGPAGWAFAAGSAPAELAGKTLAQWRDEGVMSWQAAGSQVVLAELGCTQWRVPVWDACCGQGGKSLFLLEQGVPVRLSSDLHGGRLRRVRGECQRVGVPAPLVMRADMTCPPVRHWAGNIILDVPCTGLGTLARRPDIRRHRSYAVLEEMRAVQAQLLEAAWAVLACGGELAYITCALDPQENEAQIAAFVQRHAEAACVREWQTPHTHPWLEGMYGACLRKCG